MTASQRNKALKSWLEILLFLAKLSSILSGTMRGKNSSINKRFLLLTMSWCVVLANNFCSNWQNRKSACRNRFARKIWCRTGCFCAIIQSNLLLLLHILECFLKIMSSHPTSCTKLTLGEAGSLQNHTSCKLNTTRERLLKWANTTKLKSSAHYTWDFYFTVKFDVQMLETWKTRLGQNL